MGGLFKDSHAYDETGSVNPGSVFIYFQLERLFRTSCLLKQPGNENIAIGHTDNRGVDSSRGCNVRGSVFDYLADNTCLCLYAIPGIEDNGVFGHKGLRREDAAI